MRWRPSPGSIFLEALVDGFGFPGVFRRARRPGSSTQVFASEEIEPLVSVEQSVREELLAMARGQNLPKRGKQAAEQAAAYHPTAAKEAHESEH